MSTCYYCGASVEFRYVDGRCIPFHPDGPCSAAGGASSYRLSLHAGSAVADIQCVHGSVASLYAAMRSGSRWVTTFGDEPFSYPTHCWSCGELVLAHSNGFHDFVLLDLPPGRPWRVHGCYELRHTIVDLGSVIGLELHPPCGISDVVQVPHGSCVGWIDDVDPPDLQRDPPYTKRVHVAGTDVSAWHTVDYWRRSLRPGRLVWVTCQDPQALLPIYWEKRVEIGELLNGRAQECRLAAEHGYHIDDKGILVSISDGGGGAYVVPNTDIVGLGRARIALHGEKPRLLWILTDRNIIVPVLIRKYYGNVRVGTRVSFKGHWERLGQDWYLLAERCDAI